MMEALYRRYGDTGSIHSIGKRIRYFRKKYAWIWVVGMAKFLGRALDILISLVVLIPAIPLLILVAVSIKLTDGGQVLFSQTRVGKWGREFQFIKFRSMVVNAEALKDTMQAQSHHQDSITFKMKNDPRITRIGRIIRKSSIDELPQIWNVLKGDMSVVGPRPPPAQRSGPIYAFRSQKAGCQTRSDVYLAGQWQGGSALFPAG
ncbi:MAG: sugar transferase [Pseudomonadota bacterium]